jgi:hypothetical protein
MARNFGEMVEKLGPDPLAGQRLNLRNEAMKEQLQILNDLLRKK